MHQLINYLIVKSYRLTNLKFFFPSFAELCFLLIFISGLELSLCYVKFMLNYMKICRLRTSEVSIKLVRAKSSDIFI